MTDQNGTALVTMTFMPLLTAVLIAFGQATGREKNSRWIALAGSVVTFFISLGFLGGMKSAPGDYSASFSRVWMEDWGIGFILGLDGLSGQLVILTNLLVIISIAASWTAVTERTKEFYAYLMALHTGILGTFLALDLFVFYIFWELMLIPLYLLIGVFGSERRVYAAMKFILYTMAGSVLMLIGIMTLYFKTAPLLADKGTFSILELVTVSGQLDPGDQCFIFFTFLLAFAIKVPLFPLHTWLPDAHTQAPTAGSILLAGVLLKTGVYGLMRFAIPLFPEVAHDYAAYIIPLSVVAIIWGALAAFNQSDMKRLVAYSSVSHMGFIMLGLFSFQPQAVTGAAIQMINHGISTGALFFCVGVLYERRHTREMSEFGGLAHSMKVFTVLSVIIVLSSAALPGLNGFVGEFLVMLGAFQVYPFWTAAASLGVILAAVYLLRMVQMTFWGPLTKPENKKIADVNFREICSLGVLIILAFWIGLKPAAWIRMVEPAAVRISRVEAVPGTDSEPDQEVASESEAQTSETHDSESHN